MFAKRGVHILPITPAEQKSSTSPVLYPYLKKNDGICLPDAMRKRRTYAATSNILLNYRLAAAARRRSRETICRRRLCLSCRRRLWGAGR